MVFKKSASQNDAKVIQKKLFGWKVVVAVPKVYYL